jgi:hypothetical protein
VFTTLVEYIFDGFPMRLKITIDSDITAANNFHVQPPVGNYSNKVPKVISLFRERQSEQPGSRYSVFGICKNQPSKNSSRHSDRDHHSRDCARKQQRLTAGLRGRHNRRLWRRIFPNRYPASVA